MIEHPTRRDSYQVPFPPQRLHDASTVGLLRRKWVVVGSGYSDILKRSYSTLHHGSLGHVAKGWEPMAGWVILGSSGKSRHRPTHAHKRAMAPPARVDRIFLIFLSVGSGDALTIKELTKEQTQSEYTVTSLWERGQNIGLHTCHNNKYYHNNVAMNARFGFRIILSHEPDIK